MNQQTPEHKFVGRQRELQCLRSLLEKRSASFVVIHGRRRIGKSRLIEEFGKGSQCHIFSGLPPTAHSTKQGQLVAFAKQLSDSFDLPEVKLESWHQAFTYLAKLTKHGRYVLALDEISWMGSREPDFLGYLKNAWDLHFSKNPELILIACGSVSSWIQKNILSSTGFVGRISIDLQLQQLPLRDMYQFWNAHKNRISPYEILKVLAVTGGVPRYLEEVRPSWSAEENIRSLCFESTGLLFREFDQIFSDLFSHGMGIYEQVIRTLSNQSLSLQDLAKSLNRPETTVSDSLGNLVQAGFVTKDYTWNIRTQKTSTIMKFRLSDNYLRFYLKYIRPNARKIANGDFGLRSITGLPGYDTMMGLQFENLILANVAEILNELRLERSDILATGPYIQRATTRRKGCQIDLLIQTHFKTIYICEIKFSKNKVGVSVLSQMETQRQRLDLPKGWSTRFVLIHVNGVTSDLAQSHQIDHIIDFGQLLRQQ